MHARCEVELVHPAYKTEYRVRSWRQYEQGLRSRGDVTVDHGLPHSAFSTTAIPWRLTTRTGRPPPELAASIARYSERVSHSVEFALRKSLRCRAPCIGLARDSSRANGDRERETPLSTRRTAPDVPSLVPT